MIEDGGKRVDLALFLMGKATQFGANRNAPRKTGALAAAICVTSQNKSDYGQRVSRARALGAGTYKTLLFAGKTSPGEHTVHVQSPIHYATYQELGTRRNRAHPYLVPAFRVVVRVASTFFTTTYQYSPRMKKHWWKG
jgi:hypothetical protein